MLPWNGPGERRFNDMAYYIPEIDSYWRNRDGMLRVNDIKDRIINNERVIILYCTTDFYTEEPMYLEEFKRRRYYPVHNEETIERFHNGEV